MSQETAASMMERYLRNSQLQSSERPRSASTSSVSSEEKENVVPKKNFFTPQKKRVVEMKSSHPEAKAMSSLASPSVDTLRKKSKKDLRKDMVLLVERLNAMEENQVEYITTVTTMKDEITALETKLAQITKERDELAKKNQDLASREQSRSDAMWKNFVGGNAYAPQKPSYGL
jgi:SMC interacting uncharacterized protein involved in chromosome segregation